MNAIPQGPTSSKRNHPAFIDMTPMVDLGFLLITFFIFTSSMAETKALRLIMPDTRGSSVVKESNVATIILGKNNTVYYFEGFIENAIAGNSIFSTSFGKEGVRKLLMNKKKITGQDVVVLVKPSPDCSYADIVDAMDEIMITNVDKWMLIDADKKEKDFIRKL